MTLTFPRMTLLPKLAVFLVTTVDCRGELSRGQIRSLDSKILTRLNCFLEQSFPNFLELALH